MEKRNFKEWFATFQDSISDYKYYINFEKVNRNVNKIKLELHILSSLIGSRNIESDFREIIRKYPETLKCIPILLAVRQNEVKAIDSNGSFLYKFINSNQTIEQYIYFMHETGLFELLENHLVHNLIDYVTGVETGLDSNGRKNRGGHLMEDVVESFLEKLDVDYYKEMYAKDIEKQWNVNLSKVLNDGKSSKRFDFVIKTEKQIFVFETNFYSSGGSKLNETARSYKMLAQEFENINGLTFVWITDGPGWKSAKRNLEETFDVTSFIFNLKDLENGILINLLK